MYMKYQYLSVMSYQVPMAPDTMLNAKGYLDSNSKMNSNESLLFQKPLSSVQAPSFPLRDQISSEEIQGNQFLCRTNMETCSQQPQRDVRLSQGQTHDPVQKRDAPGTSRWRQKSGLPTRSLDSPRCRGSSCCWVGVRDPAPNWAFTGTTLTSRDPVVLVSLPLATF